MRIQLALNVSDLDEAVEFYQTLFDAEPHKRRPGYANFAVDQPPLKLVLFEQPEAGGTLKPPGYRGRRQRHRRPGNQASVRRGLGDGCQ